MLSRRGTTWGTDTKNHTTSCGSQSPGWEKQGVLGITNAMMWLVFLSDTLWFSVATTTVILVWHFPGSRLASWAGGYHF